MVNKYHYGKLSRRVSVEAKDAMLERVGNKGNLPQGIQSGKIQKRVKDTKQANKNVSDRLKKR